MSANKKGQLTSEAFNQLRAEFEKLPRPEHGAIIVLPPRVPLGQVLEFSQEVEDSTLRMFCAGYARAVRERLTRIAPLKAFVMYAPDWEKVKHALASTQARQEDFPMAGSWPAGTLWGIPVWELTCGDEVPPSVADLDMLWEGDNPPL